MLWATDHPGSTLVYKLLAAPNKGTLRLGTAVLGVGSTVTQANINAGQLSYRNIAEPDQSGTDSFTFIVSNSSKPGGVTANFAIHFTLPVTGTTSLGPGRQIGEPSDGNVHRS